MTRRVLFLDVDGVLTTNRSRSREHPAEFDPRACEALTYVMMHALPHIVLHTSWRKMPEPPPEEGPPWVHPVHGDWWYFSMDWFKSHCDYYGLYYLPPLLHPKHPIAPYKMSSNRGFEVAMWCDQHDYPHNSYVILDDETDAFSYFLKAGEVGKSSIPSDRTKLVTCHNDTGLTMKQAEAIVQWWQSKP